MLEYRGFKLVVSEVFINMAELLFKSDTVEYNQMAVDALARYEIDRYLRLGLIEKNVVFCLT